MKTLFAALVLSVSASAFAESVSFSYSGLEAWGRSYYHCDYVEAQTEKVLELFGASNINISCYGGIEHGRMEPVSINATFDAPVVTGVVERATFKGNSWDSACGINVAIVKNVLPKFSNVKVLSKRDTCSSERSRYSYDFEITK